MNFPHEKNQIFFSVTSHGQRDNWSQWGWGALSHEGGTGLWRDHKSRSLEEGMGPTLKKIRQDGVTVTSRPVRVPWSRHQPWKFQYSHHGGWLAWWEISAAIMMADWFGGNFADGCWPGGKLYQPPWWLVWPGGDFRQRPWWPAGWFVASSLTARPTCPVNEPPDKCTILKIALTL